MESLDTTILNTAVPAIAAALLVAPLSMKAVLSSYTLSLAVFIPVSGWMADRYGTRRVFSAAIGVFTIGSVLCGISNEHSHAGPLPCSARLRRRDDGAGRPSHHGSDFCQERADPRHELRRDPRAYRSDARPRGRRPHRWVPALADDLLHQCADRPARPLFYLSPSAGLSRTTHQ